MFIQLQIMGLRLGIILVILLFLIVPIGSPLIAIVAIIILVNQSWQLLLVIGVISFMFAKYSGAWVGIFLNSRYMELLEEYVIFPISRARGQLDEKLESENDNPGARTN